MIDIDFIKWIVGYADGFEIITYMGEEKITACGLLISLHDLDARIWVEVYHSLLLARAIEGLKDKDIAVIEIEIVNDDGGSMAYEPYLDANTIGRSIYLSIDRAKTEALKYVYEMETK